MIFLAVLLLWVIAPSAFAAPPLDVIFDTDMGNDVDDALALAMLHGFASRGEVRLLAVTVSKDNRWAAEYVRLVNQYYGRDTIPVGMVHHGKTPEDGLFVKQVCQQNGRHPNRALVTEAVPLLRKTLAAEPDGAVTMIQVGFSTNLAGLMQSGPDRYSNLGGIELIKKKVRSLTVMAGNFAAAKPEYNVLTDVPAATKLFESWPTDIYVSGFEVGSAILFPAASIEQDFPADNPVAQAYRLYASMPYNRPSWDLTTVLYDLRPDRGYFDVSPPGEIVVSRSGSTRFQPAAHGKRYVLRVSPLQAAMVREACVWLASQPK